MSDGEKAIIDMSCLATDRLNWLKESHSEKRFKSGILRIPWNYETMNSINIKENQQNHHYRRLIYYLKASNNRIYVSYSQAGRRYIITLLLLPFDKNNQ